jgi:hypothetical protein
MSKRGWRLLSTLPALLLALSAAPARSADTEVDVELVLAVDVSYSMDHEELELQRSGYIAAITSAPVLQAIKEGLIGKIAVAYVEWAGSADQRLVVNWQIVDDPASAQAFAEKLAAAPVARAYRTSISSALAFSAGLFEENGFNGARRAIDISGDGANNQGAIVTTTRDEVLARGIVINGLPLLLKRPNYGMVDIVNLDAYYRDCVVGGPGAFVIPVREAGQFTEAIRTKLILEIAGREPQARMIPVAGAPSMPCTIGEQQWMERFGP